MAPAEAAGEHGEQGTTWGPFIGPGRAWNPSLSERLPTSFGENIRFRKSQVPRTTHSRCLAEVRMTGVRRRAEEGMLGAFSRWSGTGHIAMRGGAVRAPFRRGGPAAVTEFQSGPLKARPLLGGHPQTRPWERSLDEGSCTTEHRGGGSCLRKNT